MTTESLPVCAVVYLMTPVYQPYTYAIPPGMAEGIRPGCRVVVPLGGGHANGVVAELSTVPPADIELKDILELVDEDPLLDTPRLELARWISRRYFAPPGECCRLFLPPGSYVDTTFRFRLTPAGHVARREPATPPSFQDKLLALVADARGLTRKEIGRKITHPGVDRALAALERKGFVTKESEVLGARTGFRRVLYVELIDREIDPADYPARQQAMLRFLREHQGPLTLARVVAESKTSHDVARALEKKGQLRIYSAESFRSPFDGYEGFAAENHRLTAAQQQVVDRVATDIRDGRSGQFLLLGVTGSGKTQVYIELIRAVLAQGRNALMMVPEISLTPALTKRFLAYFGSRLAILHSMLSDGERHDQWFRIHRGDARVVIGTRSSLFAPLANPGIIIIDEEHDSSYKQGETPRYHARDVARRWARDNGAVLLLGSATPAMESYYAATETGELELLTLPERILNRPLPEVRIVDMAREFERHGKNVILAGEIYRSVAERMKSRQQVMVLLNRRGFAAVLMCRKCGYTVQCDHCNISMTYHHGDRTLLCHYCGAMRPPPGECPECGSRYLFYLGTGTEKLEEVFRLRFPGRRVERFDRDTTRRKGSMKAILDRFERREIDLLVGTQMIAKGHDFPGVTLVVVLSTDTSLRIPDFRAAERTFQLLTQVAGRSGRGTSPGEVFIQTYYPNHYAVRLAGSQDYGRFYQQEIFYRRQLFYPPFTRLVYIGFTDPKESTGRRTADRAGAILKEVIVAAGRERELRVIGPAPALLEKVKDEYRFSILIRCLAMDGLYDVLEEFRSRCLNARLPWRRIAVDIDPLDLM